MSHLEEDSNERSKRNRERDEPNDIQEIVPDKDIRSPRAKKERYEVQKMESWKESNAEKELITVTIVINKLIANSAKEKVKKLIDCYNPLICEETDMMKEHMLSCCNDWEDKLDVLREAIRLVWPEIDIEIENTEETNKLVDILLMAIETLMPKQCKECDFYYYVSNEKKPIIRCMWCNGGAHDCIDRGNKEKLKGMTWLCRICNDILRNQIMPKIDLVKKMELIKNEASINFEGFKKKDENRNNIEEKEEIIIIEDNPIEDNNEQNRKSESSTNNSNKEKENVPKENEKKICWFFENRKCKFGPKCKNFHPEACKSTLEYGKCSDISNCNLLHPKVCRNYCNMGTCERFQCWFIHPSKIENKNPSREYSNPSYRSANNEWNSSHLRDQNYPNPEFRPTGGNSTFLGHWPTPAETSRNLHQTLSKIIGTIEKVDARMEKIEMRQMNRW